MPQFSDTVWLEIVKSISWILTVCIISLVLYWFREPIKRRLDSLTSFQVAGASFDLGSTTETLAGQALLADIQFDVLTNAHGRIEELAALLSTAQVEKLGAFAAKYLGEVPAEKWNEGLLLSISYLLTRHRKTALSLRICDSVLAQSPNNGAILDSKGLAHLTNHTHEDSNEAISIYRRLWEMDPLYKRGLFRLALAEFRIGENQLGLEKLRILVEKEYWKENPEMLNDPWLVLIRERFPNEFSELERRISELSILRQT